MEKGSRSVFPEQKTSLRSCRFEMGFSFLFSVLKLHNNSITPTQRFSTMNLEEMDPYFTELNVFN